VVVLDEEPKTFNVSSDLTFEPKAGVIAELLNKNEKDSVIQVQYIGKLDAAGGRAYSFAGTNLFDKKEPPNLTYRIDEKPRSLKYWIKQVASGDEEGLAKLRADDMRIYPEYYRKGADGVLGCAIGNANPNDKSPERWHAQVLAHEIGHVLALPHRGVKGDVGDNLKIPAGRNLMGYGAVAERSDFDLIQARVMRQSKALK
jgi:hypothetical protein